MILRPSKSPTWVPCPGATSFIEKNGIVEKPRTGVDHAALGTAAHKYAEVAILALRWPDKYKEIADERGAALPAAVRKVADRYVQWVDEFSFGRPNMFWGVERSVPLWYEPEHRGTVDFFAVDGRDLVVVDFKSGREPVSVERNPQVTIYAIALYEELKREIDVDGIVIGIMQPIENREPSFWRFTIDELYAFKREISAAAIEARSPLVEGRLVPGEKQCKYCPAKALCPAIERQMRIDFNMEVGETVSEERLFAVLSNLKVYRLWLDGIEDYVRDLPTETLQKRGWKLVQGARRFSWNAPEDEVAGYLQRMGVDPYQHKLKSPTMVKDEVGDAAIHGMYETDFNRPSLVPLSRRGKPVTKEEA
jgi:hypothetical protein